MKQTQLNQGILGVLVLVASVANAQEYPAADFQPKVLYRDESIATSAAPTPAPCVNQQQAVVTKQEVAEVDPQYPASSFQPKVIYSQGN
jgi:hypothetical protein